MARQFHGVMQNTTHHKQVGLHSVDQEVARAPHRPDRRIDMVPTQPQVPRLDASTEFRAVDAAWAAWIGCQIAKGRNDEALVPQTCRLTELLVCPPEDLPDVCLRSARQAKSDHQAAELTCEAALRPNWPMKSSS